MGKKKTHEEYILELKENRPDVEVLEIYKCARTPILHKCSCGNDKWIASPDSVLRGGKCSSCLKYKKYTYEYIKSFIESLNFNLISNSYEDVFGKLILSDNEGYYYVTNLHRLNQKIIPDKFNKFNPYTIQNIKLWCKLNNKSFELISNKYENNYTKLKLKCLKENCGELFESDWSHILSNRGCAVCHGRQVSLSNCLANKNSELTKEWHPIKNGDLTPYDVTYRSGKKVWWKCEKCSNEWQASIGQRNIGQNCPVCSFAPKKIKIGINDMWTTNKELAKLLENPEDGYKYSQSSGQRVDWKCPDCGETIKNKKISMIYNYGLSCICSDGVSYPNKFMFNLLQQLNIEFINEYSPEWIKPKRYDFYFEADNKKYIVEMDGELGHGNYNKLSGVLAEESLEIDNYKDEMANKNGIEVIRIDCKKSDLEYIKNNIINSELNNIFDLSDVDWLQCHEFACSSLVKTTCDLWNSGITNTTRICDIIKLNKSTIIKYLKQGNQIGWCDYNSKEVMRKVNKNNGMKRNKKIIQLDKNVIINTYKSIREAGRNTKINTSSISMCATGKRNQAGGYKWMFLEDHNKMMELKSSELNGVV